MIFADEQDLREFRFRQNSTGTGPASNAEHPVIGITRKSARPRALRARRPKSKLAQVQVRRFEIAGAFEFTPKSFPDDRGLFVAPFQEETFTEATGHPLRVAQTNHSVSAGNVIRGVHFADVPPGQAKYVYCPSGVLLDIVIDVRVGSPTFGQWEPVRLDSSEYRAVYLAEGLGHAFVALTDDTVMAYLCSTPYNPSAEHGINPLDPELALPWDKHLSGVPVLSDKDRHAPSLREAADAGTLPDYEACLAHYERLRLEP